MCPIPCSNNLAALVKEVQHPGLFFDRFMNYGQAGFEKYDQEEQRGHIDETIRRTNSLVATELAKNILDQWLPPSLPMRIFWKQKPIWRMTMHLSRAASTENASVCMHAVYGFAYIPGTGLKGMTRAYAQLEEGKDENDTDVKRIFGSLKNGAGTVIFHDAWPNNWPRLEKDIVNSHHPDYYSNKGVNSPPGDWENPNPVFFLAIAPETEFRFAVSPKNTDTQSISDTEIAAGWLKKALKELGAGGKTAAGYGYFSGSDGHDNSRLEVKKSAGEDAIMAVLKQLDDLAQKCLNDGGYTHTKHFDLLEAIATSICKARGTALTGEDENKINSIAGEKANEKRITKLIKKLKEF